MLKVNYIGKLYDNTYRVRAHSHDLWEVVYYTAGSGKVDIGNIHVPFEKNDIFVIPPGVPHTDYSDKGFKNYHYTFSDFSYNLKNYIKLRDTNNMDFLRILKQMYKEYHIKRKNWSNIVDSLYHVLNQYIFSLAGELEQNRYVAKVTDDIISNITNPKFDLDRTLKEIPLNSDYFRKLFYKETGKTPLQYLTQKRMDYAKELLKARKHSRLSIKEISWRAGFTDFYYFSRVFKKITGLSPREWEHEENERDEEQ